jgi:DNA-binding MarR family transcriptional regulator
VAIAPGLDCTGRALTIAARHARGMLDDALADAGVTFSGYVALAELGKDEGISQRELARRLGVEAPTLSKQIDRLVQDGFADRDTQSDRRTHALSLTDQGRRRLADLDRIVMDSDAQLTAPLTAAEKRQLRHLLGKLSAV